MSTVIIVNDTITSINKNIVSVLGRSEKKKIGENFTTPLTISPSYLYYNKRPLLLHRSAILTFFGLTNCIMIKCNLKRSLIIESWEFWQFFTLFGFSTSWSNSKQREEGGPPFDD